MRDTYPPVTDRRGTGMLAWVSANKKEIMLLLGAVLVPAGLLVCALFFTGPTRGRGGRPEPGAFGVEWARHSYFAFGAALTALGAFTIATGLVLRDKALLAALGLVAVVVSGGSLCLIGAHLHRTWREPEPTTAEGRSIWDIGRGAKSAPARPRTLFDIPIQVEEQAGLPQPAETVREGSDPLTAGKVAGLILEFAIGWALWCGMLCLGGWITSKVRKAPSGNWYNHAAWIALILAALALLRHLPH